MRDVCADFRAELAEVNGEPEHVHLLVNFPPTVAISRLVNSLKGCPSAGCGRNSRTCGSTTGGRDACGPGRTSRDRPAGHLSLSCASTSNSRTGRPDGLMPPAFTTGLKAGALAAILVALGS